MTQKTLEGERNSLMKTVADYMSKILVSIDCECSVLDAIKMMKEKSVSALLIMKESNTVGIFTERDILTKINFDALDKLPHIKIKELMTGNLKMADLNDPYITIMDSMQKNKIRHMPVVEDGFVKGMLSLRDLMNHYYENMERLLEDAVSALSTAVEKRDPYTAGHQERVMQLACAIGKEMGCSEKELSGLRMAAVIHDIGKLFIATDILTKPGKLEVEEMNLIKKHSLKGYEILKGIQFPWPIADIVLQHHERVNGTGYPNGLTGKDILFEAKVIAVADVIEAMATNRPYRPMLGMDKAMEEITKNKDILYDAGVVDACVTILKRDKLFWKTE